jgi:hypothetical protein
MINTYTHWLKKIVSLTIYLLLGQSLCGQNNILPNSEYSIKPSPTEIHIQSAKRKVPSARIYWENTLKYSALQYRFTIESPVDFSFFSIGWKSNSADITPEQFEIKYRTGPDSTHWSDWITTNGMFAPEDNKNGLFMSNILFVNDSAAHTFCEFIISANTPDSISYVMADFVNIQATTNKSGNPLKSQKISTNNACPFPDIITRDQWCNDQPDCLFPQYTPQYINASHVIIHHGASPNFYTDGLPIVRSYWNYHVYTNGWDDIGYNYLIDKYGNIYQGRYNPQLPHTDVKGTHAGNTNGQSIGVCFLGNTDSTQTSPEQIEALNNLLAGWFNLRSIDPLSEALIINQAGTQQMYLPRIIGHRDVKPATVCPGNILHSLLPQIRQQIRESLILCSGNAPSYDLSVNNLKSNTQNIDAGTHIELTFDSQLQNIPENPEINQHISFWLSGDTVFNPAYDVQLDSIVEPVAKNQNFVSHAHSVYIDSSFASNQYFLFVVSDLHNTHFETNENNNRVHIPLSVAGIYFDITVQEPNMPGGSVSGSGNYGFKSTCRLMAQPQFGYRFTGWFENNTLVSEESEYSFVVKKDRTLTASFECDYNTPPPAITGPLEICSNNEPIEYSVPDIKNVSYIWTLPPGFKGQSNTNTIWVQPDSTAGIKHISVQINNGCLMLKSSLQTQVYKTPETPDLFAVQGVLLTNSQSNIQWFYNNKILRGETQKFYTPGNDGKYYALATNKHCSSKKSNTIIWRNDTVSNALQSFMLFPNPVSSTMNIIFDKNQPHGTYITIYTLNGATVKPAIHVGGLRIIEILLNEIKTGMYILTVDSEKKQESIKFIKQ